MLSSISKYTQLWGFISLSIVFVVIFGLNFPTGQWLIGWDALNPELNFWLNLRYALFAAWQPHYGTGALIGHGYAATLPYVLASGLVNTVAPEMMVRPILTFFTWFAGGTGMYFLLSYLFKRLNRHEEDQKYLTWSQMLLAVSGAIFYSFNFGTTQIFYHPLEAFTVQFAVIPWVLLLIEKYLDRPTARTVLAVFTVTFLGSVQGFIPSSFIAFLILIGGFLLGRVVTRPSWTTLKKSIVVLMVIGLANSYWLPSFVYYTLSDSQTYLNSYQNQLTTPQFVLKTAKYGTLHDVISFQSLFLESEIFGEKVFEPWLSFWSHYPVEYWYYFVSALAIFAAIGLVLVPRYRYLLAYVLPGFLFLSALATQVPFFSQLNNLLYGVSALYEQAFRTAFTKVGIAYISIFTVLAWTSCYWLFTHLKSGFFKLPLLGLLVAALIFSILPHFQGHSFYKQLKRSIPDAYLEVINFFQSEPSEGYVADLPLGCPDGWYSYNWGYTGSGFYWYGVEQPFLSRAFDVWNKHNESYFWQTQRALRDGDFEQLDRVFDKYQVRWVLIDPNLQHCRNVAATEYQTRLIKYFEEQESYEPVFSSDRDLADPIRIFRRQYGTLNQSSRVIAQLEPVTDLDSLYSKQRAYLEKMDDLEHPQALFSQKVSRHDFVKLSQATASAEITLTNKPDGVQVLATPISLYDVSNVLEPEPCVGEGISQYEYVGESDDQPASVRLVTRQRPDCISFSASGEEFNQGGLISFETYNYAGLPLKLTVADNHSNYYLDLFVKNGANAYLIPPITPTADSIVFTISGEGLSEHPSDNLISNLKIGATDVTELEVAATAPILELNRKPIRQLYASKHLFQQHHITQEAVLLVPNSYHPGWLAWALPSGSDWWQLSDYQRLFHLRYNGWANAWQTPNCQTDAPCSWEVLILFWPQLLVFAGYTTLVGTILILSILAARKVPTRIEDNPVTTLADPPYSGTFQSRQLKKLIKNTLR